MSRTLIQFLTSVAVAVLASAQPASAQPPAEEASGPCLSSCKIATSLIHPDEARARDRVRASLLSSLARLDRIAGGRL